MGQIVRRWVNGWRKRQTGNDSASRREPGESCVVTQTERSDRVESRASDGLRPGRPVRFWGALALLLVVAALPGADSVWDGPPWPLRPTRTQRPADVTTLQRAIGPVSEAESDYAALEYKEGWPLVVRQDLAPAYPMRHRRRVPLASFVQITDVHITDAQSPERLPYARKFGVPYRTDYRAHEALTLQVADAMVQQINRQKVGPITGAPFEFVVSTGDNGDGRQINELRNYVNVLDGDLVVTDTSGEGYIGVQDNVVPLDMPEIYDQYYHPDPPPDGVEPDVFKREHGFPDYPGLLEAATENFQAAGLDVPWYSGHGNHDAAIIGYFRSTQADMDLYWTPVLTGEIPDYGSQMFLDVPDGMDIGALEGCLEAPTQACVTNIYTGTLKRPIPANPDRIQYLTDDFLRIHFESPATPGPVGHGFTNANVISNTLYYTFPLGSRITGIMLDTVNRSGKDGGAIGATQAAWLEAQLQQASSRYLDSSYAITTTGNADKLIVLFSHHNLLTMDNDTSLPGDPEPEKLLADDILKMVLRYPNVILWVNGHSHVNRVWAHRSFRSTAPLQSGFWEVNTASHIDFPQQSRTFEIVDNRDGTLSIFGILLDHMGPPATDPARLDVLGLASISRELAANDPDFQLDFQFGAPGDRNVELLLAHPFSDQFKD